jgi:hypothetical protein
VSGFQRRRGPQGYEVDLAADLVTVDPRGDPIANLCREDVHHLTKTYESSIDAIDFNTLLRFPQGFPPGDYLATLTFRDLIGGTERSHAVSFQLP